MFKFFENYLAKKEEARETKSGIDTLVEEASITSKFLLFSVLSGMIAALGIMMNNVTILIGAMLIAPLLIPVISLSVGIGAGSIRLINHSIKSLTVGFILAIGGSMLITWIVRPPAINIELYEVFSEASLYLMVSVLAGIIGVFSWFKPNTNQVIPGVAIAVALVPPVAFSGQLFFLKNYDFAIEVLQLTFLNLLGIFIGGLITFIAYAVFSKRPTLDVGEQVNSEVEKKAKK